MFKADSSSQVWLLKIPSFVASKWEGEDIGVPIGTLKVYNKQVKGSSGLEPYMTLEIPQDDWAQDIPKNYQVKVTNTRPNNEFAFAEHPNDFELAGKIEHEATLIPVIDDDYRKIMQARNNETQNLRMIQVLEESRVTHITGSDAYGKHDPFTVNLTKKKSLDKRERMPRPQLLDLLFAEFGKFPYWTFKGLQERTEQPAVYLREVLDDIAILQKKGTYNGMYCLRPEYAEKEPSNS